MGAAGHTYCGQIALPLLCSGSSPGPTEEELVVDGFAPAGYGAEGNEMFVACGTGFSLLPVRINAPPQLLTAELRPARDGTRSRLGADPAVLRSAPCQVRARPGTAPEVIHRQQ